LIPKCTYTVFKNKYSQFKNNVLVLLVLEKHSLESINIFIYYYYFNMTSRLTYPYKERTTSFFPVSRILAHTQLHFMCQFGSNSFSHFFQRSSSRVLCSLRGARMKCEFEMFCKHLLIVPHAFLMSFTWRPALVLG